MSENKSLPSSIKGELFDQLLSSIDQEFGAEVLTPPPTDPELIKVWCARVVRAINNHVITWDQFFAMFPPDYANALKAALIRLYEKKKRKQFKHF